MSRPDPRIAETLDRAAAAPDEAFPLAEAALALALRARPEVALDPYLEHLVALEADIRGRPGEPAEALAATLSIRFGYRGAVEDYDDLANADLSRVIDRRRGLPVALGILWIHVARAGGWRAAGLSFPNHFLIRVEDEDGGRTVIDPFREGRALDAASLRQLLKQVAGPEAELVPAFHAPVSDRDVLLRLLNNRKIRHLRRGAALPAIEALRDMCRIAPARGDLLRETGLLEARAGALSAAIATLGRYADLAGTGPEERRRTMALIDALRSRLN